MSQPHRRAGCSSLDLTTVEQAAKRLPNKVAVFDGKIAWASSELIDRIYGVTRQIIDLVPPGGVVVSLVSNRRRRGAGGDGEDPSRQAAP